MAIVAEVDFAHEHGALVDTLTGNPDLDLMVVRDARTAPGQSEYLVRFECDRLDEVVDALEADHTVGQVARVPWFEDQHIVGVEFAPDARLLNPEVTARNGLVLKARSGPGNRRPRGWRERWLLPDGDALQEIWQDARADGFEFDIIDLEQQGTTGTELSRTVSLTPEQRDGLVVAYRHGYFDEPRKTSLEALADELDVSPTAVGGRIKRGMKTLIWRTLVLDEDVA